MAGWHHGFSGHKLRQQKMVRNRVAWSAAVHRDVKSWTRLEDWTTTTTNIYLYIAIQK